MAETIHCATCAAEITAGTVCDYCADRVMMSAVEDALSAAVYLITGARPDVSSRLKGNFGVVAIRPAREMGRVIGAGGKTFKALEASAQTMANHLGITKIQLAADDPTDPDTEPGPMSTEEVEDKLETFLKACGFDGCQVVAVDCGVAVKVSVDRHGGLQLRSHPDLFAVVEAAIKGLRDHQKVNYELTL